MSNSINNEVGVSQGYAVGDETWVEEGLDQRADKQDQPSSLDHLNDESVSVAELGNRTETQDQLRTNQIGQDLIAELPVELGVSMGELRVSAAQLSDLQVGSVLQLNKSLADSPLTITANGAEFARAELVRIGDMIGVRLMSLKHRQG